MKYIIANWKMNMDGAKIREWFKVFNASNVEQFTDKIVIIAPSFPYLEETKELLSHKNVMLGAQDVDAVEKGAHTGAVGTFQLQEFCKYSIVGHSELKEPLETVITKRNSCLKEGLTPIVCFVDPVMAPVVEKEGALIAWEDPENISVNGTYRAKDPGDTATIMAGIDKTIAETTPLLYGGSVNRDNIRALAKIKDLDGYIVGNASLDPEHFFYIIENA